ncbi:MAG: homoserine dehydrogenase [Bacteroidia bacterium]|nr:homoserine dehydrogenase [Bacteroidia bacterium]MDW8416874.1 homoserine dehydrogenase [Bacteroidia bacterium]
MNKRIVLFGFGNVGGGFYRLFQSVKDQIPADITAIVVKHKEKHQLPLSILHAYDEGTWRECWETSDIVIECTNDPIAGWDIIFSSLQAGKIVITASKRPLAQNLSALHQWLASFPQAVIRYEAAAMASVPIFRGIADHFAQEPLAEIFGVVNGTTHYIMQEVLEKALPYAEALKQAQYLGYAEEDPYLDISGWDAAYKLVLLVWKLWGTITPLEKIPVWGISGLGMEEYKLCRKYDLLLKPVVKAKSAGDHLSLFVGPAFIPRDDVFASLQGADNGLRFEWGWAGSQFYKGKGAGPEATGSAIMGDLWNVLHNPTPGYLKNAKHLRIEGESGYFYIRGKTLVSQLSGSIFPFEGGNVWRGSSEQLREATLNMPPDSYFVALLSDEALLAQVLNK